MPSRNKTPHYGLSDWTGTDTPKWEDFSEDNRIMDRAIHEGFAQAEEAVAALDTVIYWEECTLQELATTLEGEQVEHDRRLDALEQRSGSAVQEALDQHKGDFENPHGVTAAQAEAAKEEWVGAATVELAFEETDVFEEFPGGNGRNLTWSKDGRYLAVAHNGSPGFSLYKVKHGIFYKFPTVSPAPTGVGDIVAFSPDSRYVALGCQGSTSFTRIGAVVYEIGENSLVQLATFSEVSRSNISMITFSPDSRHLIIAFYKEPYFLVYQEEGGVFSKLPDQEEMCTNTYSSIMFTPDGGYFVAMRSQSLYFYTFSNGFFSALPESTYMLPEGTNHRICFSNDGGYMTMVYRHITNSRRYIVGIYTLHNSTLQNASESDLEFESVSDITIGPNGSFLIVGTSNSLQPLTAYENINGCFRQLPDPECDVGRHILRAIDVSPDGRYLAITYDGAPYISICRANDPHPGIASLNGEGVVPDRQIPDEIVTTDNIAQVLAGLGVKLP